MIAFVAAIKYRMREIVHNTVLAALYDDGGIVVVVVSLWYLWYEYL